MSQTVRNILSAVILIALVVLGAILLMKRSGPIDEVGPGTGEEAPDFSLTRVDADEAVTLSEFRGKTVLLDFWATWCPPCREQMPVVQKLDDDPSLKDSLVVISVNADEPSADRHNKVTKYLEDNGYHFTTVMDDYTAMSAYGVSFLPTLVIVDPDGGIAHRETGVHSEKKLRKMLSSVMK